MVLLGRSAEIYAPEQLAGDIWVPRCRQEGRIPVEAGHDAVFDRAGLHLSGPANHGRHTKAAVTHRAFGVLEWRHAAVWPGEHLGPIVRSEHDDRVVGL